MTADRVLDLPAQRDPATLRRIGVLPPASRPIAVPTKALNAAIPSGPVVAHLDPGQLRAPDGKATIWSFGPSWIDSYHGSFEMWTTIESATYINLEFWGFEPGTDAVVSVRLRVNPEGDVHVSATGNPVTMLVSGQVTGGQAVTINVPIVASDYCLVSLEPGTTNQGFDWLSADLRLL